VTLCIVAKRYTLQQSVCEQVLRKYPPRNTILQLSNNPHTDRIPSKPAPLEPYVDVGNIWRINLYYLHIADKRTTKIFTSGTANVSMLHDYFRQRRTIGSFSATAELLVKSVVHCVSKRDPDIIDCNFGKD